METVISAVRNLGPMRMAVMAGVVLAVAGFLVFLTSKFTVTDKQLLYADLSGKDSSRIVQELEKRSIPYELADSGASILIPGGEIEAMRLALANQGLPGGGSIVGYELFDSSDTIGSTNFQQNVNLVRAMEGELSRTVESLDNVNKARVHLVLPKREMFSRANREPSASVILSMTGGKRLDRDEVAAVRHLVATAVPSLKPGRISIVDNRGKLLASGTDGESALGDLNAKLDERRREYENRMAQTVEQLLENTVGFGNVRAEVNAEMDFDRINTTEETYDPDGQVLRSTVVNEENNQSRDSEGPPPVTVGQNLPDPNLAAGGESLLSETSESRTEETQNFEISKKITNHVREIGSVRKLSVAVLVDGEVTFDEDGERQWNPLPERTMQLLATLVRGAVGFDAGRGDTVEVINMEFKDLVPEEEDIELFFGMDKNDLIRMAEFVVIAIVALLFVLLVIRPLISRAFEMAAAAAPEAERLLAEGAPAALLGPGGVGAPMDGAPEDDDELIDIDRVEGQVKASSVRKVGEIVEKHPEESLSIIRAWMYQEG